jgi:hypothetical protein
MNLTLLHGAVRGLVRDGATSALPSPDPSGLRDLSSAERTAIRTFQRRLQRVSGRLDELTLVSPYSGWMMPREEASARPTG